MRETCGGDGGGGGSQSVAWRRVAPACPSSRRCRCREPGRGRSRIRASTEEMSPAASVAKKLRSELEYIRLVRPAAFARATALDARDAVLRRRHPLTPPRRLWFVGSGDFRTAGEENRELFVNLGGLRTNDDVLDVGSGVGRIAVGLTGWLQGRYEG